MNVMKLCTYTLIMLSLISSFAQGQGLLKPSASGGSVIPHTTMKSPGTQADGGGDVAFVDVENASTEDGVITTTESPIGGIAASILLSDFAFAVATTDTCDSVVIRIKQRTNPGVTGVAASVHMVNSSGGIEQPSTSPADPTNITSTLSWWEYRNSSWNALLTPAFVSSSPFGAYADYNGVDGLGIEKPEIDAVQIVLYSHSVTSVTQRALGYNGGFVKK